MIQEYIALPEIGPMHNEVHRKLFDFAFSILKEVAASPPTADTLPSGYGQFYNDSATGTRRLYVNIEGELIYFEGKNA